MKKGKWAVFALVAVALLTACGGTAEEAVTTEEIVVPEMSSKDLLVNSLEYVLEEEQEGEQEPKEETEQEPEEQASGETEAEQESQSETEAVICYGRDMHSELTQETIQVTALSPEALLGALARHNIVPLLDTRVLSMEEKEQDGMTVLYLDLSRAFGEYVQTMSEEAECIIIASVVNTFLANYDVDAVYLMVEGERLETTNAVYTEEISACSPAQVQSLLMKGDAQDAEEAQDQ